MTWTSGVGRACSVLLDAIVRLLALSRINPNVDRKSTRLNSSHSQISYAVFCLKKKKAYAEAVAASEVLPTHLRLCVRIRARARRADICGDVVAVWPLRLALPPLVF